MRFIKNITIALSMAAMLSCGGDAEFGADAPTQGQGGSMTRFSIRNNYLYVLNHNSIQVYDISDDNFSALGSVTVDSGMETIFASGDYLYLGANDAMFIYSILNPAEPQFIFRYQHITSCDPVIVQGDRAYVTMRGGTACNAGANALEVLDISNPYQPELLRNYQMESPHGLGITDDLLFICEGEFGLKMFRVSEAGDIELLAHRDDFHAYDVIVRTNHAIVTGEDGIFQFTFNHDGTGLQRVSAIEVKRTPL